MFLGTTDTLFCTSGNVCNRFQSQARWAQFLALSFAKGGGWPGQTLIWGT